MRSRNWENIRQLFAQTRQGDGSFAYAEDELQRTPNSLGTDEAKTTGRFEQVDDIEQFQMNFMEWNKDQKIELQKRELANRLTDLDARGIVPGESYNDYAQRFEYMLSVISLMGELGDLERAIELGNRVRPLAEIADQEVSDPHLTAMQWILRSDILWTLANVFDQEDIFDQALDCLHSACEIVQTDTEFSRGVRESAAERHLSLADSKVNVAHNLTCARELLAPLAQTGALSVEGFINYFESLMQLGDYGAADNVAGQLIDTAMAQAKKIALVSLQEIVAAEYLSQLRSPEDFLREFGPFACPILADCKNSYLSEAWLEMYHETLSLADDQEDSSIGLLIQDVIIHDGRDSSVDQNEIVLHQGIHMRVARGEQRRTDPTIQRSIRDVPVAILFTYMNRIRASRASGTDLPKCLTFFIELGRRAFKVEAENCDHYIEEMLQYFQKHGQETNAAYECAGIYAGLLLDMIGPPDCKKMRAYVSLLEFTNHKTALERANQISDVSE